MDELIQQLREVPRVLAQLAAEVAEELLDAGPGDSWSPRTVLAHFRDTEFLEMRPAIERMLAEEVPTLAFFRADAWASSRNRGRDRKEWLLADFALQRAASVAILSGLRPEDWERQGRTGDRPPITLHDFVRTWVRHDGAHVGQLEGLLGTTLQEVLLKRASDRWVSERP